MENPGKVYILQNKRVSGLVKIGKTNQLDRRLEELNTGAGVAGRWEVVGYVITEDMGKLEIATHRLLHIVRDGQSGGSEMFDCTPDEAGIAIMEAAEKNGIEIFKDLLPQTMHALRRQKEQELMRQAELEQAETSRLERQKEFEKEKEWLNLYHNLEPALAKYVFLNSKKLENQELDKLYCEAIEKYGKHKTLNRLEYFFTVGQKKEQEIKNEWTTKFDSEKKNLIRYINRKNRIANDGIEVAIFITVFFSISFLVFFILTNINFLFSTVISDLISILFLLAVVLISIKITTILNHKFYNHRYMKLRNNSYEEMIKKGELIFGKDEMERKLK